MTLPSSLSQGVEIIVAFSFFSFNKAMACESFASSIPSVLLRTMQFAFSIWLL